MTVTTEQSQMLGTMHKKSYKDINGKKPHQPICLHINQNDIQMKKIYISF